MSDIEIQRKLLSKGMLVEVNPQTDRSRQLRVSGEIEEILTNAESHPHGILVQLVSGEKGRVKAILSGEGVVKPDSVLPSNSVMLAVTDILKKGEDHFSEFKTSSLWSQNLSREEITKRDLGLYGQNTSKVIIAKSIAGFLNADGGDLLIGVKEIKETDDVEVVGIDAELSKLKDKTLDGYRRMILDFILRKYFPDIVMNRIHDYLRVSFEELESKNVCRLNISASDRRVFLKLNNEDVFMVRIDASTRQITGEPMVEYCATRFR